MYNYADFELKTAIKTICSIGEILFSLFSGINVKVQKGKDVYKHPSLIWICTT
jgi:hypothetical protein